MAQVTITRNCISHIYSGKPLTKAVCVLLSPKPSECVKHHTTSFLLSDGDVWSCGELDWDIRETKLTASNGEFQSLLVRLVNYEVDWPCTVVVDHPVIKVKEIEILSGINGVPTNLTMDHHIYTTVTKPLFPMINGVLPFILGFNVSSNVGTIKPIVIQPVRELKQGKMTFYWISDGEFCCHAKFGNQGKEVKVFHLYQVSKWEMFIDQNGRRKLIIIDYEHSKPFKHVLFHHSLDCKASIRDVQSALSSGEEKKTNCLTSGFVETSFKNETASMMSAIDDHKHPLLQVLLHAQVDSYVYGFVSDGNHIWGAVFANPVKRGELKRNMIIKVDYYEVLVLPMWKNFHSLCIHDWCVVDESFCTTIGSPQLVYDKFNQSQIKVTLDKLQSVSKPVVQVTQVTLGKCQIFDGEDVTIGIFSECHDLRDCEIIRLTDYQWMTNGSLQILNFESISFSFVPLQG